MKTATVIAHFGEWLQGRFGPEGPIVLTTLPCPALQVSAPGDDTPPFAPDVLARFAARLGLVSLPEGVTRNFAAGIGGGASTAALIALARAAGYDGAPERLAAACIEVERASDPLMFAKPDRVLWASRQGRVLRDMPAPPRAAILGGRWGAPVRTDAGDDNFADISDLVDDWDRAARCADLPRLAALASESAHRCRAARGPADPMAELARDLGALGNTRAHTGSLRGLVFAPGTIPAHGPAALREAGLTGVMSFETGAA